MDEGKRSGKKKGIEMGDVSIKIYANLLLNELKIESIPINNLEDIIENKLEISVKESTQDTPYEGALIESNGLYGIHLKPGLPADKQRFTMCHELGHYRIVEHANQRRSFYCTKQDMSKYGKTNDIEVEANIFAAEFLMPDKYFTPDVLNSNICLDTIDVLANKYLVSRMACGYKYINTTIYENCAMIIIENNKVKWHRRSQQFADKNFFIHPGTKIDQWSLAYEFQNDMTKTPTEPQQTLAETWLPDHESIYEKYIMEDCYNIPNINQTVSFIWFNDEIDDDL